MFGNRFWGWKLAAALALIAVAGVDAERRSGSINPPLWRCLAQPERWDGARLWLPSATILEVREADYDVLSGDARIRILGRAPAPVGKRAAIAGVFHAEGPLLVAERSRVSRFDRDWRWVVELVSVIVLLVVLANFARHFLFRPSVLQLRGKD